MINNYIFQILYLVDNMVKVTIFLFPPQKLFSTIFYGKTGQSVILWRNDIFWQCSIVSKCFFCGKMAFCHKMVFCHEKNRNLCLFVVITSTDFWWIATEGKFWFPNGAFLITSESSKPEWFWQHLKEIGHGCSRFLFWVVSIAK